MKKTLAGLTLLISAITVAQPMWQIVQEGMLSARQACKAETAYCGVSFINQNGFLIGSIRFKLSNPGVLGLSKNLAETSQLLQIDTDRIVKDVLPGGKYNFLKGFQVFGYHLIFQPGGYQVNLKGHAPIYFGLGTVFYDKNKIESISSEIKQNMQMANHTHQFKYQLSKIKNQVSHSFVMSALSSADMILKRCDKEKVGCAVGVIDNEGNLDVFLKNDLASHLVSTYTVGKAMGSLFVGPTTYGGKLRHDHSPLIYIQTIDQKIRIFSGGIKLNYKGGLVGGVGIGMSALKGDKITHKEAEEAKLELLFKKHFEHTLISNCEVKPTPVKS